MFDVSDKLEVLRARFTVGREARGGRLWWDDEGEDVVGREKDEEDNEGADEDRAMGLDEVAEEEGAVVVDEDDI